MAPYCKVDADARKACTARGTDYVYTNDPLLGCTGVDTGESAEQRAAAARKQPCICVTHVEQQQRMQECINRP